MQILGGEIGAQVRAVTEDRAVLHQAKLLKQVLSGHYVVAGKQQLAVVAGHANGDRRLVSIDAIGQVA